jgi:hypothetical protein
MLNLNYNINPSGGAGNCRGEVKFNYSASILVAGGGAGLPPLTASVARGGGGAGFVWTGSLSIIPNVSYQILVAETSSLGGVGNESKFIGFDDNDTIPFTVTSLGGQIQTYNNVTTVYNGGAQGSGSLNRAGVVTNYAGYIGGVGAVGTRGGVFNAVGGGGAGATSNGGNGDINAGPGAQGGIGGTTYNAADFNPTGPSQNLLIGAGGSGESIGGASAPQQIRPSDYSQGASYNGTVGAKGGIVIKYAGEPKAFVTNATTVTVGGFTYHTFNPGTGSFTFTYPYPWTDVVPYTVEVCPDEHNEDVRPPINWDFHSFASGSDNSDITERTFATMSINAVNTNCIQVSSDSGNSFVTDAQSPVTASITGSRWPVTGSTTMSLYTAGITYDPTSTNQFFFGAISASAAQIIATPNITGSVITSSFISGEFYRWYISGSIIHMKGNPYNSPILWKTATSGVQPNGKGTNTVVNFNVNSDTNLIVGPIIVSGANAANSGSTSNNYAFSITSSLTGSAAWWDDEYFVTTTMSLSIPEASKSAISYVTQSIITASFTASSDSNYTITGSVATTAERLLINAYVVGGGGGGGYGGGTANTLIGHGSGGGAAQIVSSSFYIIPNLPVITIIGTGGAGGTSTGDLYAGRSGTTSSINYYTGPNLTNGKTTLTANSGSGGEMNGPGGTSGNGFIGGPFSSSAACPSIQSFGGGGGGTIENGFSGSINGGGGTFLGGGGGTTAGGGFENGSPTPLEFLGLTGRGGRGGYVGSGNTIVAPNDSSAYGGGGGGAVGNCSTTKVGGKGGDGIVVVTHEGTTQKLTYSGTYTTNVSGSTFYYYLTGNGNLSWIIN